MIQILTFAVTSKDTDFTEIVIDVNGTVLYANDQNRYNEWKQYFLEKYPEEELQTIPAPQEMLDAYNQIIIDKENAEKLENIYNQCNQKLLKVEDQILNQTVIMVGTQLVNGSSIKRLLEIINEKIITKTETQKIYSLNEAIYWETSTIILQDEYQSKLAIISDTFNNILGSIRENIKDLYFSKKDYQGLVNLLATITPEMADPDQIKDGKTTIIVDPTHILGIYKTLDDVQLTDSQEINDLLNREY